MKDREDERIQNIVLSVLSLRGLASSRPVGPPQLWCEAKTPLLSLLISSVFVPLVVARHEA